MKLTELHIQNFRGIKKVALEFSDATTVLIGENNTGKSTVLAAIRTALEQARNRRAPAFDDFDYYMTVEANDPHSAPPIIIDLIFREPPNEEWAPELVQPLNDVIQFDDKDVRFVWLRASSQWDATAQIFSSKAEFLDKNGNPLTGKGAQPANLTSLQRLRPFFYLSALRDAARAFTKEAQYWGSFLRGSPISAELKTQLEEELGEINHKIVQAHEPFEEVRSQLARIQQLVPTSNLADVSIEAVPGRLFDMLSKAQVSISSSTGAKVPIGRHGEGTQSLSVLLLFDAFLKSRLAKSFERSSLPIVAIEEPEAHLHPCAIRTLWKSIDSLTGQKIISSHSGDLLAEVPAERVRRLYRKGRDIEVGRLKSGTLTDHESRMFNQHVRLSRGELLFANCWILCEGESESQLLRSCSETLGADLIRWGIRVVEYRTSDIEVYLKVARDFGISWHCLSDNDNQAQADHRKARNYLAGQAEGDRLTILPEANIEQYLATAGFFALYEGALTPHTQQQVTSAKGTPNYVKEVVQAVTKKRKPELMAKVVAEIETKGKSAIPQLVKSVLRKAVTLAGGTIA